MCVHGIMNLKLYLDMVILCANVLLACASLYSSFMGKTIKCYKCGPAVNDCLEASSGILETVQAF